MNHRTQVAARAEILDLTATPTALLYVPEGSRRQACVIDRLGQVDLQVTTASDVAHAVQLLRAQSFGLCLVDLAAERPSLAAIRAIRAQHPHPPIAGLFDSGNPLRAADAIHAGAIDLLPWPFDAREASTLVANARDLIPVQSPDQIMATAAIESLVAQSPSMRRVTELVNAAASGRAGVCVVGERGTGRNLVARTIHQRGTDGGNRPFVTEDCAGDTPQELERRLFGVMGAGPQAVPRSGTEQLARGGALYSARGGTLLLLNLIEASARVQARLARVLRDREAVLVNGRRAVIDLDLQPIATFDLTLDAAVADGRLRADLYKQLAQVRIDMPALRRRREDIPVLAMQVVRQICQSRGVQIKSFSRAAIQLLMALPWNGNATELRALMETLVTKGNDPVIHLEDLLECAPLDGGAEPVDVRATLRDAKARFERDCISAVLARHHGRVPEAARALGIQRTNLYRKIRQLNVARSLLSARR